MTIKITEAHTINRVNGVQHDATYPRPIANNRTINGHATSPPGASPWLTTSRGSRQH